MKKDLQDKLANGCPINPLPVKIESPKKTSNTINDDLDKVRKMKMERIREMNQENYDNDMPTTVDSITELLNESNIIQKSRKTVKQIYSSSLIKAKNNLLQSRLGITNKFTTNFNDLFELEIISLNGLGRRELIEMAQSLTEHQIMQNQVATKPTNAGPNALINVNPPQMR